MLLRMWVVVGNDYMGVRGDLRACGANVLPSVDPEVWLGSALDDTSVGASDGRRTAVR